MFRFKNKSSKPVALNALGFTERGVGFARVVRERDAPPVLADCEFAPVEDPQGWGEAVAKLKRARRLAGRCTVVLEEDAYSLLLVEAPEVPPEELRAAVRWRIRELIDFHVDDAIIDVFDVPGQNNSARAAMMYVVAARVARVGEKVELARRHGLALNVVDIPELAQRNLAATFPEDVAGVALLCLSPRSGLISLTRQTVLYLARRLDAGTDTIARIDTGHRSPADDFVRGWLDGLVVEVQRSLDYYESNFAQPPIGSLVIAPAEAPVQGIADYLGEQLGITTRMLELDSLIDVEDRVDDAMQARCLPAIGAALRVEERTL